MLGTMQWMYIGIGELCDFGHNCGVYSGIGAYASIMKSCYKHNRLILENYFKITTTTTGLAFLSCCFWPFDQL